MEWVIIQTPTTNIAKILKLSEGCDVCFIVKCSSDGISPIGTIFASNKTIMYFDELRYFTAISAIDFEGCSNLRRVSINSSSVSFAYMDCSARSGCRWNVIRMNTKGFTSTYATSGMSSLTFIFRQNSVVAVQSGMRGFGSIKIYVPDNLVDTYKTSGNWPAYASYIHPISEYTGV